MPLDLFEIDSGITGKAPERKALAGTGPRDLLEETAIPRPSDRTKGPGFFGALRRPDGSVSTELSIEVNLDGKETEIPMLVPTLSRADIDFLLVGGTPTEAIVQKAVDHARVRINQRESPFASEGERRLGPTAISQETADRPLIERALRAVGIPTVRERGLSEAAKARALVELKAREEGVPLHEYREAPEAMEQVAEHFVSGATAGIYPAVRRALTGEEPLPATSKKGKAAAGVGELAGFVFGPAKLGAEAITKALPSVAAKLAPKIGEKAVPRIIRTMMRDAMHLAPAIGITRTGEALEKQTWGEAATEIKGGVISGAALGAVFGASRGMFPKGVEDRAKRIVTGLVGLNALRAVEDPAHALPTDRLLEDVVFDTAMDVFFLWQGLGPRGLAKVEKDLKRGKVSPEINLAREQRIAKEKPTKEPTKDLVGKATEERQAEIDQRAKAWLKEYAPKGLEPEIKEAMKKRVEPKSRDLVAEAAERRQRAIERETKPELLAQDKVTQHVDAALIAEKQGKPEIAKREAERAREGAEAVRVADGPEATRAVEAELARLPEEKAVAKAKPAVGEKVVPFPKRTPAEKKIIEKYNKQMTSEEWQEAYKEEAHWMKDKEHSPLADEMIKDLERENIKGANVLEIGAGNGRDSIYMAQKGHNVIGVDIAKKAIETAQKKAKGIKNVRFEVADAENLQFEPESFDAVYSVAALHSTPLRFTLREINRVLKPGGTAKLFLYTRTKTGAKWVSYWTPGEIKQFAKQEGFRIETFRDKRDAEPIDIPGVEGKVEQETHIAITTLRKPKLKATPTVTLEAKPQVFRMAEATKVTSTQGKEVTLPKGEEYMAYPAGEGKIKLQDGKQVTVFEGELAKLKGQMLPEGEQPIAGAMGPREKIKGRIRRITGQIPEGKLTIKERDALKIKIRAEAKVAREAKVAGKKELEAKHKQTIQELKAKLKAGFEKKVAKVRTAKQILENRRGFIKAVQKQFGLSGADLRKITKRDIRLMNNLEFKTFLDDIRVKAEQFEVKQQAANELELLRKDKEFTGEDNIRKFHKLPTIKNMTTKQLNEYAEILSKYKKGDQFLTPKRIKGIEDTPWEGSKTIRQVLEKASKELGVPIKDIMGIRVKELDRFRYDTALARQNPFYNYMVDTIKLEEFKAMTNYFEARGELYRLGKLALKSRKRGLLGRVVPRQRELMRYLEAEGEAKIEAAQKLTKEELALGQYVWDFYSKAYDSLLISQELKSSRFADSKYVFHSKRPLGELLIDIKDTGIKSAARDLLNRWRLDEAHFKILDSKTGKILGLKKFFRQTLYRTGELTPTKNVIKATDIYMQQFFRKMALDKSVPAIETLAMALRPKEKTKTGIFLNDSLMTLVRQYLNNKKGRTVNIGIQQGGRIDTAIRFVNQAVSLRYIALNVPLQVAAIVGETTGKYVGLGKRKLVLANIRKATPRGRRILKKYKAYVGEGVFEEVFQPARNIGENINMLLYGLFKWNRKVTKQDILLGNMTRAEYKAETISPEKLAEVTRLTGRWIDIEGAKSIMGSTSTGAAITKFRGWAIPIASSATHDATSLARTLTRLGNPQKRLNKQQAQELYRIAEIGAIVGTVLSLSVDEDKDTFMGKLKYYALRELGTIFNALSTRTMLTLGVTVAFLEKLSQNLYLLLTLEKYKTKDELRGVRALKKQLTPAAVTQFTGRDKESQRARKSLDSGLRGLEGSGLKGL